jgi:hypothetical protein
MLCISDPVRRSVAVDSGGLGGCSGAFALDMNCFASGSCGGNPAASLQIPGERIDAQWWGRDSLATGSHVSDALAYVVGP